MYGERILISILHIPGSLNPKYTIVGVNITIIHRPSPCVPRIFIWTVIFYVKNLNTKHDRHLTTTPNTTVVIIITIIINIATTLHPFTSS